MFNSREYEMLRMMRMCRKFQKHVFVSLSKSARAPYAKREKQSLGARVTELERVVAEGEACLRDMENEREKQRCKYKRATAAETAGRLAAEATAAALRDEVARLHGTLERFGFGLKPPAAVETVDCMTSPMPTGSRMMVDADLDAEEEEEDEDATMTDNNDATMADNDAMMMDNNDATMTVSCDSCESGTKKTTGTRATTTPWTGDDASSSDILSMTPVKTPLTSVKAAARAIEASVIKATTTTKTTTPGGGGGGGADMEDSAFGGGGGMGSAGPASVASKPVNKSAVAAGMSPAAFRFEYTPLSKPTAAAAAARTCTGAGAGAGAAPLAARAPVFSGAGASPGVVSLAADFASAADVDLFAVLMTLMQCVCALFAVASRRLAPIASVGVGGCVKVALGLLVTALVVIGLLLAAEVALQLSGDPPGLAVPIRMGGVPPRESLRRVTAA